MVKKIFKFISVATGILVATPILAIFCYVIYLHALSFFNYQFLEQSIRKKKFDEICLAQSYSLRRDVDKNFSVEIGDRTINVGNKWSYSMENDGIHAALFLKHEIVEKVLPVKSSNVGKYLKNGKSNICLDLSSDED